MSPVSIEPLGEDALLLRLDRRIDPALNARVHALARRMEAAQLPWLREVVPAYASLALGVDTRTLTLEDAAAALQALLVEDAAAPPSPPATVVEIPVCHAPAFAPDLDAVAARAGLDRDQAIALHCAGRYQVAMTGFAPGFPYLLGLDPRLATPRRSSPRPRVPAGSVAIGGAQTGIYPGPGPGGWHLVGRTPLALFNPDRDPPCLLPPGTAVRFVAIDEARFHALADGAAA